MTPTLTISPQPGDLVAYYREKWRAESPCTFERACSDFTSGWSLSGPCDNCMWVEFQMDRLYEAMRAEKQCAR